MKSYGRRAALALITFTLLFSFADAQKNAPPPKTTDELTGWVSDSKCGVKGATLAHAECMRQCIESGADIVVVADSTNALVHIENPADLKSHYAQRVLLDGYWMSGQFHVISIRRI